MLSRTPWRIDSWNGETGSITILVGIGGGGAEIGLRNTSTGADHTLFCTGVTVSAGLGVSIPGVSFPSGFLGFQSEPRTGLGRIYKNNRVVPGELTLDIIRDCIIMVTAVEFSVFDEGQSAYLVMFTTSTANLIALLGGGGPLSQIIALGNCRAAAFLFAGSAGLPNIGIAGYRYTVGHVE